MIRTSHKAYIYNDVFVFQMMTVMCCSALRRSRSRLMRRWYAIAAAVCRSSNRWHESMQTPLTYGSTYTAACWSQPMLYHEKTRLLSPISRGRVTATVDGWTWTSRACFGRVNVIIVMMRPPRLFWNSRCGIRQPERSVLETRRTQTTADILFCTLSWTERWTRVRVRRQWPSGAQVKRNGKNETAALVTAVAKNVVGPPRPVVFVGPTASPKPRLLWGTTAWPSTAAAGVAGTNVAGNRCVSFSPTFRVSIL